MGASDFCWQRFPLYEEENKGIHFNLNALDPSEKPTKIMNLEKGVKIGSCWNEFNSEIRKSLKWRSFYCHFLVFTLHFHRTVEICVYSENSLLMEIWVKLYSYLTLEKDINGCWNVERIVICWKLKICCLPSSIYYT